MEDCSVLFCLTDQFGIEEPIRFDAIPGGEPVITGNDCRYREMSIGVGGDRSEQLCACAAGVRNQDNLGTGCGLIAPTATPSTCPAFRLITISRTLDSAAENRSGAFRTSDWPSRAALR